ncbi:MAG: GtrA family protein [Alphaproteobacteria bacterium]|nr:GtrA family protein [Alphaproteobacteria bacterium]
MSFFANEYLKSVSIYIAVTFGALFMDFGVANLFVYVFNFPLVISGAFGLFAGTITNYFIHLHITFKDRLLSASWNGLWKYIKTCLIGAGIRVFILAILAIFSNMASITSLIIATGVSLTINYLLSRFYVFRHPV